MKHIVILGAGFGGLETATGLAAALGRPGQGWQITLIDRSDSFFVGFSKIDVLFGRRTEAQVRYPFSRLRAEGVRFVQAEVTAITPSAAAPAGGPAGGSVTTSAGELPFDYLVVALGADLAPAATPGFVESGGHEFYSMAGANRLRPVLESFSSGTLVLGILGAPYKCPPAPYEVACQMHEAFVKRGVRERITMKMVIPSPRPVPNPVVAAALERHLAERDIALLAGQPVASVDAPARRVMLGDPAAPTAVPYDLFLGVPAHVPPAVVRTSGLAQKGFIEPSPLNLETSIPGVYAVGDVTKIPAGDAAVPKAGAFAEDAARTVVSDILAREGVGGARVKFEARGACYFDLGRGEVAKIDANYFGGEKPRMALEGPAASFNADKESFESTRAARWFKP